VNLLSQILTAGPVAPVAIWLILILVSMPALFLLGSPPALRHPRIAALQLLGAVRRYRRDQRRLRSEAVGAVRFAEEVQVAADRADESAQRWQSAWRQAEEQAGTAWQAWRDADRRLARVRSASAYATPVAPRTAAEYADRERSLHRMLHAAVASGDLPGSALRAGWDARLHPVEQELVLLKAVAEHRRAAYRRAVAAEHSAWHDAQLAFAARDSLRREATAARERAAALRTNLPRPRRRLAPVRPAWIHRPA
jgi:hypothetical protein